MQITNAYSAGEFAKKTTAIGTRLSEGAKYNNIAPSNIKTKNKAKYPYCDKNSCTKIVEVFGLKGDKLNEPNPDEYQEDKVNVHSDDEIPSIAINPFRNKGKEEDAFYAYGISEDLISNVI